MDSRPQNAPRWVRFGGFEVDLRSGELSRQGRRVPLHDKPCQVLVSLLRSPGELVTREELQQRLWSDTVVDFDNNLNAAISRLREALDDSAHGPRFIETVPRKGYRFVGPPPVWEGGDRTAPDQPTSGRRWRFVGLVAMLAVVAAAVFLALRPQEPKPELVGRSMLAVLPFENLSDDPGQDYLAHGMTEELLTELGGVAPERLGVIARTSVRRYQSSDKTVEEIGAELGVDFVIEGSVRVHGERLRVAVQLIQVSDQTHVWAESYDRETRDLLGIQSEVAVAVAAAILPKLLLDGSGAQAGTESSEAYEQYLRGLEALAGDDVPSSRRAAEHFERAVALDPDYARAWVALARARNFVWFGAENDDEARRISARAREAARRALELDPSLPEAYVELGFARFYHDWDPRGAAEALAPPLASAPNSADARRLAAAAYSALARHDEALAVADELSKLDPGSLSSKTTLGWYHLFARRPAEAEAICRQVLETEPEDRSAEECLYQALLRNGKPTEAVRVLGRALIREGVPIERFESLDAENPEEIERIRLEHIFTGAEDDRDAPFDAAVAFARLGDFDRAFAGLEMALERRDFRLLYLGVDPRFDALRGDPRFGELQKSMDFMDEMDLMD